MTINSKKTTEDPGTNDSPSVDALVSNVDRSSRQDETSASVKNDQLLKDNDSHQTRPTRSKLREEKESLATTDGYDSFTAGKHIGDLTQLESEFGNLSLHKGDTITRQSWASQNQARTSSRDSPQNFNKQPNTFYQQPDRHTQNTKKPKDNRFLTSGRTKNRERDLSMPTLNLLPRPQPIAGYLKQACKMSTRLEISRPLLIIVDLNGCLLDRGKNKGGIGHHRPYLKEFLEYSLDHHHVMVWSSATPFNVSSMSKHAFTGLLKQPIAVWDRRNLRLTEDQARQKVQVYKQLDWVWDDKEISKFHPYALSGGTWNQTNTILIDDSIEKAAAQPHNQLLVPEYKKGNEKREKGTKVLLKVIEYLKEAAYYEDVSSFIFNIPFQKWVETRSTSDQTSGKVGAVDAKQV